MAEQRDTQKMLPWTEGTEGTCVPVMRLGRKRHPTPRGGGEKLKSLEKLVLSSLSKPLSSC